MDVVMEHLRIRIQLLSVVIIGPMPTALRLESSGLFLSLNCFIQD
jgi:hypothetical protein